MCEDNTRCALRAAQYVLVTRLPATADPAAKGELLDLALECIAGATEEWELVKQHLLGRNLLVHAYAMLLLYYIEEAELLGKKDDPIQREKCQQLCEELANAGRDMARFELLELIDQRIAAVFGSLD